MFNCFLNFNINIGQPRFGFNFGCFSMPNFFSGMPFFNNFNYFSPTSWFQQYSNPMMYSSPSVFGYMNNNPMPTFNQNSSVFMNYQTDFSNAWMQNSTMQMPSFDTFNWTTNISSSSSSDKKTKDKDVDDNFTYNNEKDIYSTKNAEEIKQLTSDMQERTKKLIAYANSKGYDVEIISGYRSQAEQDKLRAKYEAQGQKKRAAKISPHTSGKAIDIRVYKNGKKCEAGYDLLGKYAVDELGMRWGGNFKNWMVEKWHFDYGWRTA